MADYEQILSDLKDGVLTLTLNRPDRLNAWTDVMHNELKHAIVTASSDDAVRVIVVTGAGRGFCAGADMDVLQGIQGGARDRLAEIEEAPSDLRDLYPGRFGYMYACPKPIIAAINGACAGIGLIFALFADLRYAAAEAKFTTAFAQRGLIAEHGIAWLLPRLIGEAKALDLLFTARKFTGAEAAELGLVNAALPVGELMGNVQHTAHHLATMVSPRSVAVMKQQVRKTYFQSFGDSLAEADAAMEESFTTFDFKEGVASFVERRAAQFKGR
ncbi:enoyl-CoA hydratase [Hyphomonas sp. GM-8P]|uniref:enoyl-CoA hydratase n=1 Tax=Hyphomonas sp. GM-8P TaxID=1280945 RepID=UPI000DD2E8D2|nr:enoyl-CoA hydratase [Hyphomonas sp. GM-8P]